MTIKERAELVDRKNSKLSIRKQCKLLYVPRYLIYYRRKGESEENLSIMGIIMRKFEEDPTYGVRRMTAYLRRSGYQVNHKRVERLMKKMRLKAVYPARKTTTKTDTKYKPINLLKSFRIRKLNDVWFMDITYVRISGGFGYAAAVVDGYSRKVLSLKVNNRMSGDLCFSAIEEAVRRYGIPKVVHTDRGSQFTSRRFLVYLERLGGRSSFWGERF